MAEIGGIQFRIIGNDSGASRSLDRLADSMRRVKTASSGMSNVAGTIRKISGSLLKLSVTPLKSLARPFKEGISSVTRFASKLGEVASGFKRILGYRLIRTLIKEIGQAFREGVQHVYDWSRAMRDAGSGDLGRFADSMDDIATSLAYFKNSIGAAVAPLVNMLAPAIDTVTNSVVALLNAINQLLARLTGQSSWTRATRHAEEYGDAVGGAGGAAKEALKYLAPFDELNVLPSQRSGGGGGGLDDDVGGLFEEMEEFEDGISNFADRIRAAIDAENWKELGTILGEKVNEIVDSIDWAGIGTSIGKKINAWFTTKYWTLETINFTNIGAKIAEFLNNAISNIDFSVIGASLVQKFTILGNLIIGAVENIDWAQVGESIGSFVRGAFNQASAWLDGLNLYDLGYSLVTKISNLFSGIDFSSTVQSVKNAIHTAFVKAGNFLEGVLDGISEEVFNLKIELGVTDPQITDKTGMDKTAWQGRLYSALAPVAGAAIGLVLGGPGGALFGAALGLGLKSAINYISPLTDKSGWGETMWKDALYDSLEPVLGALIGLSKAGLGGALFGATIGLSLKWAIDYIDKQITNKSGDLTLDDWANALIAVLFPIDGAILGFMAAPSGVAGALIGLTIGLSISWFITHVDPIDEFEGTDINDFWLKYAGINYVPPLTIPLDFDSMSLAEKWNNLRSQLESHGLEDFIWRVPVGFEEKAPEELREQLEHMVKIDEEGMYELWIPVSLLPDDWDGSGTVGGNQTVHDFVKHRRGDNFRAGVGLKQDGWSSVSDWLSDPELMGKTVSKGILLAKSGWTYVSEWLKDTARSGGVVNKPIGIVKGGWTYVSEWLKDTARSGGTVNKPIGLGKTGWSDLGSWLKKSDQYGGPVDKKVTLSTVMSTLAATIETMLFVAVWNSLKDKTITLTVEMNNKVQNEINSIKGAWNTMAVAWNNVPILKNKAWLWTLANGGIVSSGQMFIAREAGPELVGTYGNKSAVMNNDQIVRSVSDGVAKAISNIHFAVAGMPSAYSDEYGMDEDAVYRAMVRALTDTGGGETEIDVNLDGDVLYRHMVRRNRANTRMTGVNAMA